MGRLLVVLVSLCAAAVGSTGQETFLNFESPPIHPLRVSPDGTRLFAVNTADNRLVVWNLANPDAPALLKEIPVGLEPVSITARSEDEVWVVNHLSDSVSVVSVSAGRVLHTLRVVDEPTDVAFAAGRAFVTAAARDEVAVFDLATFAPLGTIPIFGKDPRALAVSPAGDRLYVMVHHSGNRTTFVGTDLAPPQPAPDNPALPPAPEVSLIVSLDDPAWAPLVPYDLPDVDVVEIDPTSLSITREISGVGTTLYDLAVHPGSGDLFVVNTEARNTVRFEPVLRGHCIDSRVTRISMGEPAEVTPTDLNPDIDYGLLPNPAALATALAEPGAVLVDAGAARLYVAAQGTDRVGVLDLDGNVLDRIDLGPAPGPVGGASPTAGIRGPRGLALHPDSGRLYVFNRFSNSVSVVDPAAGQVLHELPVGAHDPTPVETSVGRRFLYDAKLSGNGTMSCAACHVDGDVDFLAWDLGNPAGEMFPAPDDQPFPFNQLLEDMHPMKGPFMTQTLKGLTGVGSLHWRGDKPTFQDFNPAFDGLMGGSELPVDDMELFAAFGTSIVFPPNPNQPLDRQYSDQPPETNQAAGLDAFLNMTFPFVPLAADLACASCHDPGNGTNGFVMGQLVDFGSPQMKIPQLRSSYRKLGFSKEPGPAKSGFGFGHVGSHESVRGFLDSLIFDAWPTDIKDDIDAFVMAFDTGTAPLVGYQARAFQGNWSEPEVQAQWVLMSSRAAAGDIDLTARGLLDGETRSLLYDPLADVLLTDRAADPPLSLPELEVLLTAGDTDLLFTGVAPGSGQRIALDRDLDGVLDGDEGVVRYGPATAGCAGEPRIDVNSEPALGNAQFGIVGEAAPPLGTGLLAVSPEIGHLTASGLTILVNLLSPESLLLLVASDANGSVVMPAPIPTSPALAGLEVYLQFAWNDGCSPAGYAASAGLVVTIQP
jgi:YVTN family beta-propeller protein